MDMIGNDSLQSHFSQQGRIKLHGGKMVVPMSILRQHCTQMFQPFEQGISQNIFSHKNSQFNINIYMRILLCVHTNVLRYMLFYHLNQHMQYFLVSHEDYCLLGELLPDSQSLFRELFLFTSHLKGCEIKGIKMPMTDKTEKIALNKLF